MVAENLWMQISLLDIFYDHVLFYIILIRMSRVNIFEARFIYLKMAVTYHLFPTTQTISCRNTSYRIHTLRPFTE
jgi:hypothetical protein